MLLHPLSPFVSPLVTIYVARAAERYIRSGHVKRPESGRFSGADLVIERLAAIATTLLFAVWIARFAGWFGGPVVLKS